MRRSTRATKSAQSWPSARAGRVGGRMKAPHTIAIDGEKVAQLVNRDRLGDARDVEVA